MRGTKCPLGEPPPHGDRDPLGREQVPHERVLNKSSNTSQRGPCCAPLSPLEKQRSMFLTELGSTGRANPGADAAASPPSRPLGQVPVLLWPRLGATPSVCRGNGSLPPGPGRTAAHTQPRLRAPAQGHGASPGAGRGGAATCPRQGNAHSGEGRPRRPLSHCPSGGQTPGGSQAKALQIPAGKLHATRTSEKELYRASDPQDGRRLFPVTERSPLPQAQL